MKRVTGIGGVFFRAKDPTATGAWYKEHLGVPTGEDGQTLFRWRDDEQPERRGMTVWAAFDADTEYFGNPAQQSMINYRVENLDALLEELQREGVEIVPQREEYDFGKFAWIVDPDGNRIELWEPPQSDACTGAPCAAGERTGPFPVFTASDGIVAGNGSHGHRAVCASGLPLRPRLQARNLRIDMAVVHALDGQPAAKPSVLGVECVDVRVQGAVLGVQRFDRGQRDAIFVDRGDVPVVLADAERRVEVLRHRAHVTDAVLRLVAPAADRQPRELREHGVVVQRHDVGFGVAVAQ